LQSAKCRDQTIPHRVDVQASPRHQLSVQEHVISSSCSTMVDETPVPDPPLPLMLEIAAPPPTTHPEPRTTLENVLSSHPKPPPFSHWRSWLPPASDRSPRHASGGNAALNMSSLEVEMPRLQASMETGPQDHPTLAVVLCPRDQQRASSEMPAQESTRAHESLCSENGDEWFGHGDEDFMRGNSVTASSRLRLR
jgi:hypothetical protein